MFIQPYGMPKGRSVGGFAAHAVIVSGKIIRLGIGADNTHRVGGKPAHPTGFNARGVGLSGYQ